jgi:hypothetical protein
LHSSQPYSVKKIFWHCQLAFLTATHTVSVDVCGFWERCPLATCFLSITCFVSVTWSLGSKYPHFYPVVRPENLPKIRLSQAWKIVSTSGAIQKICPPFFLLLNIWSYIQFISYGYGSGIWITNFVWIWIRMLIF